MSVLALWEGMHSHRQGELPLELNPKNIISCPGVHQYPLHPRATPMLQLFGHSKVATGSTLVLKYSIFAIGRHLQCDTYLQP